MWKHVLNVRNILMLFIFVVFAVIIVSQQSALKSEIEAYRQAKTQAEDVERELDEVRAEREAAKNGETDEDIARADGYVDDEEIVFIYD